MCPWQMAFAYDFVKDTELKTQLFSQGKQESYAEKTLREMSEALKKSEQEAYPVAVIRIRFIKSPVGRWTLLRKSTELCAIRFTEFHYERSRERPQAQTDASYFAAYDWARQNDGSEDFNKPGIQLGHSFANKKPNIWRFPRGTDVIKCGSLNAGWGYPNKISLVAQNFDSETSNRSNDIEIAVTGWKNFQEINVRDPRLIWRRYIPERDIKHINDEAIVIPVESLPGASEAK